MSVNKFYLADVKHGTVLGGIVEEKGVLFFEHGVAGFDGRATKEHIKEYHIEYADFKKAHPDYVPTLEKHVEVGVAIHTAVKEEIKLIEEPEAVKQEPVLEEKKSKKAKE